MKNIEENLLSIGEFAQIAGVTQRALRYYDNIGLLKSHKINETDHRMYTKKDFSKLQKILTLKYIGLSLKEIKKITETDLEEKDFMQSLEIQKKIIEDKLNHMKMVLSSISQTIDIFKNDERSNWDEFLNIINVINIDNSWMKQYENASNLKNRIKIHELFSTNKTGWMKWFFNKLQLSSTIKVLELGCGDGSLWVKNINCIPAELDLTLSDFSQGMLSDAKENLSPFKKSFKFKLIDIQSITFPDECFDIVIANNMLYHVLDLDVALAEVKRVLKKDGIFYASTVGKNHMRELRDIVKAMDSDNITSVSWNTTEKFHLENGIKILSEYFKSVIVEKYQDNLLIYEAEPLIDYIFSMPGNNKNKVEKDKIEYMISYLKKEISKNNGIFINKDTGFFKAIK